MENNRNSPSETKPVTTPTKVKFSRSPYRERTHVVRIPGSMLPHVRKLLEEWRQDALKDVFKKK